MKRAIQIICFVLLLGCFAGGLSGAEETGFQLVSKTETAVINWTDGVLNAVGKGTPPEEYYGDERGHEVALAAAIKNARSKLMSAVKEIAIDADSTVGDLIEADSDVLAELQEMVDMAEIDQYKFITDGSVEVTVQMSMNGGFTQLVLPKVIEQYEPINGTPVISAGGENDGGSVMGDVVAGPYTGMIIYVRGFDVTPCMAPRVYDENGKEVFGPTYASREFAVQNGMTGYMSDMDAAARHPRVADRPLRLRGLRAGGAGGTDIIVSNTDAAQILSAYENMELLRQCRVMIVVDKPDDCGEG